MSCIFPFFRKQHRADDPLNMMSRSLPKSHRDHVQTSNDDGDDVARKLSMLTLRDPVGQQHGGGPFVGGFHPALGVAPTGRSSPACSAPPLARRVPSSPPSFDSSARARTAPQHNLQRQPAAPPAPQYLSRPPMSRTMQYAMSVEQPGSGGRPFERLPRPVPEDDTEYERVSSQEFYPRAPVNPPPGPSTPQRPPLGLAKPATAPILRRPAPPTFPSPSNAARPARGRSVSSPPSPTLSAVKLVKDTLDPLRCSQITQQGRQCLRAGKYRAALESIDPELEEQLRSYCHQHMKDLLKSSEFRIQDGLWGQFPDWIPNYLQPSTQVNLRTEMQNKLSDADEPGYLYVIEYKGDEEYLFLKVGRTNKVYRRHSEWGRQCGSKEPHLRYFCPCLEELKGEVITSERVVQVPPGPWCHRWERLVLLELADLAVNAPYLDPGFPNKPADSKEQKLLKRQPCPDCGRAHRELFKFPRAKEGPYKGKECEKLIIPVIEKYSNLVKMLSKDDARD